jgi:hypothetical protein
VNSRSNSPVYGLILAIPRRGISVTILVLIMASMVLGVGDAVG